MLRFVAVPISLLEAPSYRVTGSKFYHPSRKCLWSLPRLVLTDQKKTHSSLNIFLFSCCFMQKKAYGTCCFLRSVFCHFCNQINLENFKKSHKNTYTGAKNIPKNYLPLQHCHFNQQLTLLLNHFYTTVRSFGKLLSLWKKKLLRYGYCTQE